MAEYKYCPCGERFIGSGLRCIVCREYYWTQYHEGIPYRLRVERWEVLEKAEVLG